MFLILLLKKVKVFPFNHSIKLQYSHRSKRFTKTNLFNKFSLKSKPSRPEVKQSRYKACFNLLKPR